MEAKIDILMVDDRIENLLALEAVLSSEDYRLIGLSSGEDALRYVLKEEIDRLAVILLDVQMPGLNGIETARLLKDRDKTRDIPIIFITAISKSPEHVLEGYQAGSIDYLFKPFDPELLRLKVEAFVKVHKYQRSIKKQGEALRLQTQDLKQTIKKIIHSSPNLIAIRRLDNMQYVDVNEAWVRTTGYTYEDVIGESGNILKFSAESVGVEPIRMVDFNRNQPILYTTKAGEQRSGFISTEMIEIDEIACLMIVITDTTEKTNWEKEFSRLERLNVVGEMAASIAHEIRNPMTTIRGFLQLSQRNRNMSPEYIDLMLEELNRANEIISEYLALIKNKSNHATQQDLNVIIESLHPLIQADAMMGGKHIKLHLNSCPMIVLDEKEMRQLILNMVINGFDAMEKGGRLTISTYQEMDKVVLRIDDQGSGISEEDLNKIGTPFFTTKEKGTGLGLAVCYRIAERHNATIDAKSGKGGTSFFVRFRV